MILTIRQVQNARIPKLYCAKYLIFQENHSQKRQLPFLGPSEWRYRLTTKVKVSSHQKLGFRSGVGFLTWHIFNLVITFDGENLNHWNLGFSCILDFKNSWHLSRHNFAWYPQNCQCKLCGLLTIDIFGAFFLHL